jgi:hypothetical protein
VEAADVDASALPRAEDADLFEALPREQDVGLGDAQKLVVPPTGCRRTLHVRCRVN